MKDDILVAIHCLAYNHEPYIRDCLDGFVMQKTNFKFVAIVHDDASTDGTANIIKEYAEKYPDIIKPIFEIENQYSKKDGSLQCIMNDAIEATGAKYIAMCEGDDYWIDPYKLQKQVDFMEANPDVGLCYTDYNVCDNKGVIIEESHYEKGGNSPILNFQDHLFKQGYIAPMTWLYRHDVYVKLRENMFVASDGTFVMALEFFMNSSVRYLSETTATYRISQGTASRPITLRALFYYRKGVYKVAYEYASRYYTEKIASLIIQSKEVEELYPLAVALDMQDYIQQCRSYVEENPFVDLLNIENESSYKEKYESIQRSNSYIIGKKIIKPLSYLRRMLKDVNMGGVNVLDKGKIFFIPLGSNTFYKVQHIQNEILVVIHCIAYNHEPYIRECLDGFVMQKTNFKFVAIVHDDASTDGTANIIKEYAEKYPDIIKPIFETENQWSKMDGSLCRIMNEAIGETGAKYVAMCEGDDYWIDPCKLQKQVDFMETNPNFSICFHKVNTLINGKGEFKGEFIVDDMPKKSTIYDLAIRNYIHTPSVLYRRNKSVQEKYARIIPCLPGDYVLWMLLAETGDIYKFDETMAVYRYGSGIWSNKNSITNDLSYLSTISRLYAVIDNKEAKTNLLEQINIIKKELVLLYNDCVKQYESVKDSKVYKLGKVLLLPLKLFKNNA